MRIHLLAGGMLVTLVSLGGFAWTLNKFIVSSVQQRISEPVGVTSKTIKHGYDHIQYFPDNPNLHHEIAALKAVRHEARLKRNAINTSLK